MQYQRVFPEYISEGPFNENQRRCLYGRSKHRCALLGPLGAGHCRNRPQIWCLLLQHCLSCPGKQRRCRGKCQRYIYGCVEPASTPSSCDSCNIPWKITRRISINRWKAKNTAKRGGGQITLTLEELDDCVDGTQDIESAYESNELVWAFNRFLDTLPETERDVFLRRYWFFDPIADIAESFGFTQSKVTSMLYRTRGKLRKQLEKESFL